ncbi:hypothetical protein [Streptomyces sp. NPDC056105]|uniref:hypothetical protein n=1 Tax=Streptomyces sp. NPDC056105 TaxID=3345714 RepID=UPI0035DBDE6C
MSAPTTARWLRTAVQRIAVGSGRRATYLAAWTAHRARRVWTGARRWLDDGTGLGWWLRAAVLLLAVLILRKIATSVGVGIYHRIAHGGAPILCWGAVAWWAVSAHRAGADGWQPKYPAVPAAAAPPPDEEPTPQRDEPETGGPAAPPVSPVELVAAVRDVGTPHAQLKPLAEHLRTSTDAVRAAAAALGWPVKDVRMQGRSASAGLAWPPPPLPPLSGVVGAGQLADDNDDDSRGKGPGEGLRVVHTDNGLTVYDLADTHRHYGARGHWAEKPVPGTPKDGR